MSAFQEAEIIPPFTVTGAYAGSVIYSPGGAYGPRIQPDLQLVLVHSGSMTIEIDNVTHPILPGHVVLLKPGHLENFWFAEHCRTWHRWIAVSVETLDRLAFDRFACLPLFISLSDRMNQLTDILLSLQSSGSQDREEVVKAIGRTAILLFMTECRQGNANDRKHPAVLRAKDEIHTRYAEEITLQRLSNLCKNTPEHLIRLFRRDEGLTPIQYLWNYRVKQGIELLRSTGLQIGEVAEQAGFKTSYHFARTIKRCSGKTPTEIRKESYNKTIAAKKE
jgi:AraC family transcriptional regulator of arabinose operon